MIDIVKYSMFANVPTRLYFFAIIQVCQHLDKASLIMSDYFH